MNDTIEVGHAQWISVADTAKLVRQALAREFPAYRFTVRSESYAGGAAISVGWTDGPPTRAVHPLLSRYCGSGFDGMIDLAYGVESWLLPDGSACLADSPGTEGSRGVHPAVLTDPPHPAARLVHFGADHVTAQRDLTAEAEALIARKAVERFGTADYLNEPWAAQLRNRWMFPPCRFTWTVGRGFGDNRVVEEAGFTSHTAARAAARRLEKTRQPRGWRWIEAHRCP